MFRIALFVAVGIFLLAANVWFARSVYRALFGKPRLTVRIEVIGKKEEVASLEKGLAQMVGTRLLKIKEDLKGTPERSRSEVPRRPPADDLSRVANLPPGFKLVEYSPLLEDLEFRIPEEPSIKVTIGGVEVEGLFKWIKRQFNPSQMVSFSVDAKGEGSAFIAGDLHTLSGAGRNVIWANAPLAAKEIADTIAHAVAQKELASPGTPVHALEVSEFQKLLSLLLRIEHLNKKLLQDREPIREELKALLPEARNLREKLPRWHKLTYLVASISDSAGDSDAALSLYKQLESAREREASPLEAEIWKRIAARIDALKPQFGGLEPAVLPSVRYGQERLTSPRRVSAVLQIDWVAGTPQPELVVGTRDGSQTIEKILSEVGIELTVKWSNELPLAVMGPDGFFRREELMATMESYRSDVPPDVWHFYLIYGGRGEYPGMTSIMFDSDRRRGAAVFESSSETDANWPVFQMIHEMGHMLNLPHPWQAYGDTKSVMSFPHRWEERGWSWDDPSVYRFDTFGQEHVRRGPEAYVKPGMSRFLDYGAPLPWAE